MSKKRFGYNHEIILIINAKNTNYYQSQVPNRLRKLFSVYLDPCLNKARRSSRIVRLPRTLSLYQGFEHYIAIFFYLWKPIILFIYNRGKSNTSDILKPNLVRIEGSLQIMVIVCETHSKAYQSTFIRNPPRNKLILENFYVRNIVNRDIIPLYIVSRVLLQWNFVLSFVLGSISKKSIVHLEKSLKT